MAKKQRVFLNYIQPRLKFGNSGKRLIIVALLGLMLSFGIHEFPGVIASEPMGNKISVKASSQEVENEAIRLPIADAISQQSSVSQQVGDLVSQARALNNRGKQLLEMGQAEAALNIWKQAQEFYSQADNQEGAIGSQINQARALEALGYNRRACDRVLQAFDPEKKCDDLTVDNLEKVVTVKSENESESAIEISDRLKVVSLQTLGDILRKIGKLEESIQVLKSAKNLSAPQEKSFIYLSLGNATRELARREQTRGEMSSFALLKGEALDFYDKVIYEPESSELLKLQARLNKLSFLIELPEDRTAEINQLRQYIDQQIKNLSESDRSISREGIVAQINYATLLKLLKDKNPINAPTNWEIAEILKPAIQQAEQLGNERLLSSAKGTLGEILQDFNLLEEALGIAQKIEAGEIAYRWQWQLGHMLKENGDEEGAIDYYKAAFDTLQILRSDLVALNREIQFDFRESVEPVYREYVELLLRSDTPSQGNLKQARNVIEGLQIAELDNFFQDACANVKLENLDNLVDNANRPTAVIYMIVLKQRLGVIVKLSNQKKLLYHQENLNQNIEDSVLKVRQSIDGRTDGTQDILKQMYNLLMRYFDQNVLTKKKINNLVFVLDNPLRNFPMAALYDGEAKQYLVEKYAITLAPGLQLVDPKPLEQEESEVLAAGLSEAREPFEALPSVEAELNQIKPNVKLLNQAFTTSELENLINSQTFSITHLATHGQFSSKAEDTFILAWDGRINVKDLDRLLRIRDKNILKPMELLVLSACETARGDDRATLGIAGIAVRAGARSTLATLWQVADDSTAELMNQFYQKISQNSREITVTKAEALKEAQLFLLHNTKYKHPFFWAAYILVGNWQ